LLGGDQSASASDVSSLVRDSCYGGEIYLPKEQDLFFSWTSSFQPGEGVDHLAEL
jgi:hypothetical protein